MKEIKLDGIDETVYYKKLDNGLRVYMLVNKHVNSFYITFSVKYGSIHTEFKNNSNEEFKVHDGVAHFLEHVNFNEKNGFTAHDYFKKIGSNINAFTTFDFTCYEVMGTSKFRKNLEHLLDYVQTPYFTKELIEKEKGIIVEEVKMGKDNPGRKLFYGMNKCLYRKDKRRNLVTGEVEDVEATTVEEIKNVYDNFYHPENMFLIITGNFKVEDALRIIEDNQNKKEFIKYKEPIIIQEEEDREVNKEFEKIEANVEIPKLKISYKMPYSLFDKYDRVTIQAYLDLLCSSNFGGSSEFREYLINNQIVNYIVSNVELFNDIITINITADTREPEKAIELIKDKMKNLLVSEDDLLRKKRCNIANMIKDLDDIEYVNTEMAYQLITYDHLITNMFDVYNSLNMKDLKEIINRIDITNNSTVLLVPIKKDS